MRELATDRAGLEILHLGDCFGLLKSVPVGRVGFTAGGEVVILPVNFTVDGQDVVFVTGAGSKLSGVEVGQYVGFEADSFDQPHDVITQPVVLTVSVHGNDVPVPQAGGRPRLPFKAFPHPLGFEKRDDLDRHAAVGRLLAGLEDNSHAAAADLAENAEFAEQLVGQRLDRAVLERCPLAIRFPVLKRGQDGKQFANLIGVLWVFFDIRVDIGSTVAT